MDPIAQIKDKLNIIDIISPYVNLRKRGSNWFGLCPFHNEKSASFSINEEHGYYHCFGCGESGDIFTFIEKVEHLDFKGALEILAKQANVDLSQGQYDKKYAERKNKLIEINEFAKKFFSWVLKEHQSGERGRDYLKKRFITPSSVDTFGLGYAPIGYDNLYKKLVARGYSDQEILDSGVCILKEKNHSIIDKFRGRLMFPIENISGNIVGFSGRHIPVPNENKEFEPPKYLNTAETGIFNKGKILYGYNQAKDEIVKKGFVILSEGQVNIISSHQMGHKNITASMGTALTIDHLKLISRYTRNLYFCFDNDSAGRKALDRSAKMALTMDLEIRVISLKFGSDPDEEIKKDPDSWTGDIDGAKDLFDFLIDEAKRAYKTINDKNQILTGFIEYYFACTNPIKRDVMVQKLSNEFDIPYESLIEFFAQKKPADTKLNNVAVENTNHRLDKSVETSGLEEYTLALICQNYDTLREYLLPENSLFFGQYQTLYEKLTAENIETLMEDADLVHDIEKLLTKSMPDHKSIEEAFLDCIMSLKRNFVKTRVKSLKEELTFADEGKQEQILQEIDELIRLLHE